MIRTILAPASVTVLLLLHTATAAPITQKLPAETSFVLRVDTQQLTQTPAFQTFMNNRADGMINFTEQLYQWSGVDIDYVDSAWLIVKQKDVAGLILKGDFQVEAIRQAVRAIPDAQIVIREGLPVAALLPDKKKPGRVNLGAVFDSETVGIGNPDFMDTIIKSFTGTGERLPAATTAQLAGMDRSDAILHAFMFSAGPLNAEPVPWMKYLADAEFKITRREYYQVDVLLTLRKPGMAPVLRDSAKNLIDLYGMLDQRDRKLPGLAEALLETLEVSARNNRLALQWLLAEEDINHLVKTATKTRGMPGAGLGKKPRRRKNRNQQRR